MLKKKKSKSDQYNFMVKKQCIILPGHNYQCVIMLFKLLYQTDVEESCGSTTVYQFSLFLCIFTYSKHQKIAFIFFFICLKIVLYHLAAIQIWKTHHFLGPNLSLMNFSNFAISGISITENDVFSQNFVPRALGTTLGTFEASDCYQICQFTGLQD